ncbi:MAG: hypothetical protein ACRYFX_07220 [Janthinobacterium lividum]
MFEAKNFLPFFWLTLLDTTLLAACEKWWLEDERLRMQKDEHEYERFADIWPPLTAIAIDLDTLQKNATRTQFYLQQFRPELVGIYPEFIRYLAAQIPAENDCLRLEISSLSAFSSMQEYRQEVAAQLAALDQQQPLLPGVISMQLVDLIGFVEEETFGEEYPGLRQLTQERKRKQGQRFPQAVESPVNAGNKKLVSFNFGKEKIDSQLLLFTLILFTLLSWGANKLVWGGTTYGCPLPFYPRLETSSGKNVTWLALSIDELVTVFLAWHLRGMVLAVGELVSYWRRL